MMAGKLSMNEATTKRITEEIVALGYQGFYSEGKRRKDPDGAHRLAHLVPELAPDQAALARLLAEYAIQHRGDDFNGDGCLQAEREFYTALGNDRKIQKLVERAPNDGISWLACEHFLHRANRVYMHKKDGDIDQYEKRVAPIPESITQLMERQFRGEINRPEHSDLELRNDAIIFAVHLTLEADIKATNGNPNACQIVGDLLHLGIPTIRCVWQMREYKTYRGARLRR